ncbi:MAG: N-acetylmuramoyl-L-alanine amidase [Thermomicrobiales bacterium]
MSSHWRSSRWSSAREREEQERARAEEKTQTRRDTPGRTPKSDPEPRVKTDPKTAAKSASELSDLIASSARKPRERKWPHPDEPKAEPAPATTAKPTRARTRRKLDATVTTAGAGPSLPNLPDELSSFSGKDKGRGPNRPLIFGLLLFVAMGVIAFNPGDIFPAIGGGGDADPTVTQPSMILPTAVNTQQTDQIEAESTQTGAEPGEQTAARPEIICLDAGHGGWDTGYVREANERAPFLEEADINLAMSYMLKERLEDEGFTVILTRPSAAAVNIFNQDVNNDGRVASDVQRDADDQDGNRDELQARINICNEAGADILISMHINGFDDAAARGYEILYTAEREFGQQSADLAFDVYSEMTVSFEEVGFVTDPRGAKPDLEMEDTAQHEGRSERHFIMTGPAVNASDFSITPSEMPGIICEAGFISNDADAAFLADPVNQLVVVNAYADGIINYFTRYPGTFPR